MKIFNAIKDICIRLKIIKHVTAQITYINPHEVLKDKKIIITGGNRGLGYAMARKFISEGAKVLITGRNSEAIKSAAEKLGCEYTVLDVMNVEDFDAFMSKADQILGGANVLVNNAGISLHENSFLDVSDNQYSVQFDTNLRAPFFLTQAFIRNCMASNRHGIKKVLFISSETGFTVDDRPYGLSKVALNSLIQGIASKYVKDGFRINGIAPGITATDMTGFDENGSLFLYSNPTERVFLPAEIAEVACFMVSDVSNIINGQILACNEGNTINTRW